MERERWSESPSRRRYSEVLILMVEDESPSLPAGERAGGRQCTSFIPLAEESCFAPGFQFNAGTGPIPIVSLRQCTFPITEAQQDQNIRNRE